jgi:hypothetical protein
MTRSRKSQDKYRAYWDYPNSPFKSETAWWTWLRGSIRRMWSRSPVKIAYKQSRRYKAPIGRGGKEVWCSDCEMCGKQSRDCQVDHIDGGYGFKTWEEFSEWAKRILLVSFDDIRELCKDCHDAVSYQQRTGCTLEEAKAEKLAIALCKSKEDKQWLLDRNILPASSAPKRRIQIVEALTKEENK